MSESELPYSWQELSDSRTAALDEVWRLRRQLAYEASLVRKYLARSRFPRGYVKTAEMQIERMERCALRGSSENDVPTQAIRDAALAIGFTTLTGPEWEKERKQPKHG